jgi:phosphoglycerol transferase
VLRGDCEILARVKRTLVSEGAWAIGAAALGLIAAVFVLELWNANLRVPIFSVNGDGNLTLASIKGVIEHGWYETNSNLGAPFGQVNHDFPVYTGEFGSVLEIKLLSLFLAHAAVVMNAFVILSFPLTAFTAFLVMRRLGLRRPVALVCAALFAVAPYHFVRAQAHLFYANYWAVPLDAYLILSVLGGEELLARRPGVDGWRGWLSKRTLATVGIGVLAGTGGLYFAAFTCLLLVLSALIASISGRRLMPLAAAGVVLVAIVVPVAATAAPEVIYRAEHGTNQAVAQRETFESLRFGLPPIQLLLPISGHRIPGLAHLRARYEADTALPGAGVQGPLPDDSLGLLGAIGLVWLAVGVAGAALGSGWREPLARRAGLAALLTVALGATAGLGALFAYLVTPQIRAWDRIAIVIAFFAELGVGLLLARGFAALSRRRRAGRLLAPALLASVLVLGVLDGTSTEFIPPYAAYAASWRAESAFVAAIQHSQPRGAMVLVLPYVPFPEALGPGGLDSYSELGLYLHSTTLRWSPGAMSGRPADWLGRVSNEPVGRLLAGAVAGGYTGLVVERAAYPGAGAALAAALTAQTGAPPFPDPDGSAYYFNLLAYRARLLARIGPARFAAIAYETLYPPFFATGFYPPEAVGDGRVRYWARSRASIVFRSPRPRTVRFSSVLATVLPGTWTATATLPGGRRVTTPITSAGTPFQRTFRLPAGTSAIVFGTNAPRVPGLRDLHFELLDPRMTTG